MDSSPNPDGASPRATVAGITIMVSAALALVAIAHHPTVEHATSRADVLARIVAMSAVDEAVHAVVIAAACGLLFGLASFAVRRGLRDAGVLAGLIAYAAGTGPAIAAGLIDGFLVPAIAARYAAAPPQAVDTALQLLTGCAAAIQIATTTWLLAASFAVLIWSFRLVRLGGLPRTVGAAGVVATAVALAVLAFTANLNPHSLGIVVLVQTLWYVAVGALMIRGEL